MSRKEISSTRGGFSYDGSGVGNSPTFIFSNASKYGSIINPLLERIIEKYDPEIDQNNNGELPDPDIKLDYNNVKVFSEDIIDCVGFLSLIEEQVDAIDDELPGSKNKLLRAINQNYKNHRRQLLIRESTPIIDKPLVISTIRGNSDFLLQEVTNSIIENAEIDLHSFPVEDVRDSAMLIVCYGFINCKILERPHDY